MVGTWRVTQSYPDKNGVLELHVITDLMLTNPAGNVFNGKDARRYCATVDGVL